MKLRIEKAIYGGDGLGACSRRQNDLFPGTLPGELVEATIAADRRSFATSELNASPRVLSRACRTRLRICSPLRRVPVPARESCLSVADEARYFAGDDGARARRGSCRDGESGWAAVGLSQPRPSAFDGRCAWLSPARIASAVAGNPLSDRCSPDRTSNRRRRPHRREMPTSKASARKWNSLPTASKINSSSPFCPAHDSDSAIRPWKHSLSNCKWRFRRSWAWGCCRSNP